MWTLRQQRLRCKLDAPQRHIGSNFSQRNTHLKAFRSLKRGGGGMKLMIFNL
jgi:hypothetical protein